MANRVTNYRTINFTIFQENVPLERMERAIELFKKEIPWDFIVYDEE